MSTRKSLFFSFLDRYASLAISVGSSMVIARLLTPAEIGIFSVTMVMLMFLASVRDMGAGSYLVQERELTIERIRAVWTVQLGLGLALACLVLLASYPVALFYNEPRMRNIMLVVALNYAVNPFGSLTYAWLMREMRFDNVALMRFASAVCGALVSIGLAWNNYGPISLAFGSLASTVVNALVAVYFRPKFFPWLPGLGEIKRVLAFGSKLSAGDIVSVLSGGTPELLLGKLQSLASAGLYSRANGLVQMFHRLITDAVGSVCLPWFARQSREKGDFSEPFLKSTAYVTALGWSFCVIIIFLAHPIVRILYGNQWDSSVDLARALAVATIFSIPASLCHIALLSLGEVSSIFKLIIFNAILTISFVAFSAPHGLTAVSIAIIFSSLGSSVYSLRLTSRKIGLPLYRLLSDFSKSAQVALCVAIAPAFVFGIYGPAPAAIVLPLILGGTGGAVGFFLGLYLFKHPLREEISPIWLKMKLW